MSVSPILLAIARLRFREAISLSSGWNLPSSNVFVKLYTSIRLMCELWLARYPTSARVRQLLKPLRTYLFGRKKALLVGIRDPVAPSPESIPQLHEPATASPGDSLSPRTRHRAVPKKKKKKKAAGFDVLKGPHHDVRAMRGILIEQYGYDAEDVMVLIDDGGPRHLQPTRANILLYMEELVAGVRDGDKLFFHYSGHADQADTDDIEEEDGKNEYIITSDYGSIMDDELHSALVKPLTNIKCTLTAVLDCCHSGSLLDLHHSHCNNVYVPWLNKGKRRTKTLWAANPIFMESESSAMDMGMSFTAIPEKIATTSEEKPKPTRLTIDTVTAVYPTPPQSIESRQASFNIPVFAVTTASPPPDAMDFTSPGHYMEASPAAVFRYCTGMCREDPFHLQASDALRNRPEVICLSATKDSEIAWEDGQGNSMTQYLVKSLKEDPRPNLHNLLTSVSHQIHSFYVNELHDMAQNFKKELTVKGKRSTDPRGDIVEMHNFQNPQLSSIFPLNMNQVFNP